MRSFFFLSILFISTGLLAQTGDPDLPSEQVEVIKIFEAQLTESEKLPVSPELPELNNEVKQQQYEVPSRTFNLEYPAPRIRPISYKTDEEIPDVYNAYAKLGGGLPAAIYGEGAYHTSIKRDGNSSYDLGLNVLHHSADLSSGDTENQTFGLTKAEGIGTYYFEEGFAVGANMGFTSDRVSYYGYNNVRDNQFENITKESVKQLFSIFDLGAKIFNGEQTAGDLNYSAGFDFYGMGDEFASNETGFDLKASATKWINDQHSFDLGLRTDFTWYNDTMEFSQTLHNYTISPAFTYHADMFKAKLGGKIISHNDEFEIFPDAEAVLNLTGNELALFAGIEGGLKKNTFRTLAGYNPFIHTRFPDNTLRNTRYFDVYGGIRGNLTIFEYSAKVSYKPTNDLALYRLRELRTDPQMLINDFVVVYEDVNVISIGGSITAKPLKGLVLTGTVNKSFFDIQGINREAWHLPSLEVNVLGQYSSNDNKFKATAQLFLQDGVWAETRSPSGISNQFNARLNSLFDLSLGGEYWFVKNFGAFIQLNNLFDNTRARWIYYPTYGTNVLGGITLRF